MDIPIASLVAALVVASAYVVGEKWGGSEAAERFWARRRFLSAAAGISVAYIFVDVLPELELQRQVVVKSGLGASLFPDEQKIYVLALLSFVVIYGLEHIVLVNRQRTRNAMQCGATPSIGCSSQAMPPTVL